jgi:tetratricopeptide (TPR) repeat protein
MAPDLLFHPVFHEPEARAGVSHRKVVHPTAQHRVDQLHNPINRLRLVAAEHVLKLPQQRRPLFEFGRVVSTPNAPQTAHPAEVEPQKAEALASAEVLRFVGEPRVFDAGALAVARGLPRPLQHPVRFMSRPEARRAVALAPGSADMADLASLVLTSCGHPLEAAGLAEKAIAQSAHPGMYLGVAGHAYHHCGRIEEAITAFKAYHARSPRFGLVDLVIIYQQAGRVQEAQEAARALMARQTITIASWAKTRFRCDKTRFAAEIAALKEAGLPDG